METRSRIIEATRDLLAEVGIDGTTIKAICQRAGILPGSFYNLFTSKEEALVTVVRQAIAAVDPDKDGEGTDTIDDLVEAWVEFVEGQPELARIYLQIAVTGNGSDRHLAGRLLRHHHYRIERFADAIARGDASLSEAEAHERAQHLIATLNGFLVTKLLEPGFDLASRARAQVTAGAPTPR
ncbi:MAG: TetR/AcrR family transcriptional regulator [Actinobacteria bacterium]|nr:TetR/AcrR family transcriptional regulator [Actinomycetota bacterium]